MPQPQRKSLYTRRELMNEVNIKVAYLCRGEYYYAVMLYNCECGSVYTANLKWPYRSSFTSYGPVM